MNKKIINDKKRNWRNKKMEGMKTIPKKPLTPNKEKKREDNKT